MHHSKPRFVRDLDSRVLCRFAPRSRLVRGWVLSLWYAPRFLFSSPWLRSLDFSHFVCRCLLNSPLFALRDWKAWMLHEDTAACFQVERDIKSVGSLLLGTLTTSEFKWNKHLQFAYQPLFLHWSGTHSVTTTYRRALNYWAMLVSSFTKLWDREIHVPLEETQAGVVVSIVLSLISMGTLSVCLCRSIRDEMVIAISWRDLARRVQNVKDWSRLPVVCWLVLVIYVDSISFVAGTAILSNGFGVSSSATMCSRAILLCLACYMTTKVRKDNTTFWWYWVLTSNRWYGYIPRQGDVDANNLSFSTIS